MIFDFILFLLLGMDNLLLIGFIGDQLLLLRVSRVLLNFLSILDNCIIWVLLIWLVVLVANLLYFPGHLVTDGLLWCRYLITVGDLAYGAILQHKFEHCLLSSLLLDLQSLRG